MGNEGIYSVGLESVYQIVQSGKTESFADVSREVLKYSLAKQKVSRMSRGKSLPVSYS